MFDASELLIRVRSCQHYLSGRSQCLRAPIQFIKSRSRYVVPVCQFHVEVRKRRGDDVQPVDPH